MEKINEGGNQTIIKHYHYGNDSNEGSNDDNNECSSEGKQDDNNEGSQNDGDQSEPTTTAIRLKIM